MLHYCYIMLQVKCHVYYLTVLVDQVHAVRGVDAVQVVPIMRAHRHAPEIQILPMYLDEDKYRYLLHATFD